MGRAGIAVVRERTVATSAFAAALFAPALFAAALFAAVLAAGCGAGLIEAPPRVTQPRSVVVVTLQRRYTVVGFPATMFFSINGQRIYGLRNGEVWCFRIDPGEYRFGYELGFSSCQQRVILDPGKRYYIELSPICEINPRVI